MADLERLRKEAHEIAELAFAATDEAVKLEKDGKQKEADEKATEASEYLDRLDRVQESMKLLERAEAQRKLFNEPAEHLPLGGSEGVPPTPPAKGFKSLGEQLNTVAMMTMHPGFTDPRLPPPGAKALGLNEGIGSEGGFLVQSDFSSELLRKTYEVADIANRTRRIPISATANGLKINAIDETSRATGSRWGGIHGYWLSEAGTKVASKPKFRQMELSLKKWIGLCYATDELLADTVALESIFMQGFQDEMRFQIDDSLYEGDGVGKPLGMMESGALVTVSKEVGQAAATIVAENIVKMWARMWGPSRRNAVWYINQDTEPQLYTMSLAVGAGGGAVYMPAGGLSASPFATLMGRPVIPLEFCETLGTAGDIMLADPSQILMIDKGGMQTATSVHVQFLTDETAFRSVYRTDAQSVWNAPLTPFKGTNTLSPFVVLETRS